MNSGIRKDFLGVSRPDIGDAEIEEVLDTLRSGWLTSGPKVSRFQQDLGAYVEASHVRALNSCTAGLMLALRLLGLGPGDEVLVPANTFVACANAVEHVGARPVLVDCEPLTGLIDFGHAASLVGPRTRAVLPVHLGGRPVDRDTLTAFSRRHCLEVIEDAAHALGASWRGAPVGSWGNLTSFSFHATKNITAFEGGALVCRTPAEAERVERLALHGLSRSAWNRHGSGSASQYDVIEPGFKFGMTDVSAAVGLHQLRRLDAWIDRREELARAYDEQLAGLPVKRQPEVGPGVRHARHLQVVLLCEDAAVGRDAAIAALRERGVGATVHFRGVHLQSYYRDTYGIRPEDLPVSTDWSQRALTLPLHPQLTSSDVERVTSALCDVLEPARAVA